MAARYIARQTSPHACRVQPQRVAKGLQMTVSAAAYEDLLVEYKPRPIRSDAECRRARRALATLMTPRPTRAQSELIEVLATLIEQYESKVHPTPDVPARKVLGHLMESRDISRAELARATGIP